MKELSIDEKARAYDEAIERARKLYNSEETSADVEIACETIFPKLAESEDERMRKMCMKYLDREYQHCSFADDKKNIEKCIVWLEKQGEQKPIVDGILTATNYDKLFQNCKVHKFNIGDWVVTSYGKVNQVIAVDEDGDGFTLDDDTYFSGSWKDGYHLWTIKDAKDGDVICYKDEISLYKCEISLYRKDIKPETSFGGFMYHYCYDGKRFIMNNFYSLTEQDKTDIHPATEEQRGLLFAKMKEAGYEWDAENKELRKIDQSELTEFEDAVKDMMNAYRDAIGANDVTTEEIKKHAKYLLSLIPHKPIEQKLSNSEKIGKNEKPMWTEDDEKRLQSCIVELQGKGLMGGVDTIDTKWLKSLKQRIHASSAKTCKNDTLLDLLNKIPSCITVDGIDYHFVLKKTIAYMAFYEGEGEGSGKVIFWMAGDPVDLLTEMLEKLKEKGLLE
jgi:hypothetical protein